MLEAKFEMEMTNHGAKIMPYMMPKALKRCRRTVNDKVRKIPSPKITNSDWGNFSMRGRLMETFEGANDFRLRGRRKEGILEPSPPGKHPPQKTSPCRSSDHPSTPPPARLNAAFNSCPSRPTGTFSKKLSLGGGTFSGGKSPRCWGRDFQKNGNAFFNLKLLND